MAVPSSPPRQSKGEVVRFRLFVAGSSPRSSQAVENLRRLGDGALEGRYEMEVVDVLESPERAEEDRILATPTLIKHAPLPQRRVMGDLSDTETVLRVLAPGARMGSTEGEGS